MPQCTIILIENSIVRRPGSGRIMPGTGHKVVEEEKEKSDE